MLFVPSGRSESKNSDPEPNHINFIFFISATFYLRNPGFAKLENSQALGLQGLGLGLGVSGLLFIGL